MRARSIGVGPLALCVSLSACGSSPAASGTNSRGGSSGDEAGAGSFGGSSNNPDGEASNNPDGGNGAAGSGTDAGVAGGGEASTGGSEAGSPTSTTRLVGYLPNYNGSYADWAKKLDFAKMTHLNLAFADPPTCKGGCTASSDMTFSTGDDQDIPAIVKAAHAAGVKVLASIGGGGGDQNIIQFYKAGLSTQLIASLDSYVKTNDLDGVDLDIEDPSNMSTPYDTFVDKLVSNFHPEGKLVTAAIAQWIEQSLSASDQTAFDSTIAKFDFCNVMVYSSLNAATSGMNYYSQKGLPNSQITLGVPFFGSATDGSGNETDEPSYGQILGAYSTAWQTDEVSGGSLDNGEMITYVRRGEHGEGDDARQAVRRHHDLGSHRGCTRAAFAPHDHSG